MMKKIITLFILSILLVACNQDDNVGLSQENIVTPNVTFAITGGMSNITIDETSINADDGLTYTITATLDQAVSYDTYIDLTKTGGSADSNDYSISRIFIPALAVVGEGSIVFYKTPNIEGDENLTLTANTSSPNVSGNTVFNFTISNDYVDTGLYLTFDWCTDGEFTATNNNDDVITGNFDNIDLDFYVFDGAFTFLGDFQAATGSCPEEFYISDADYADGTYFFAMDLWSNPYSAFGLGVNVPINVSYRYGYETTENAVAHAIVLSTDDTSLFAGMLVVTKTAGVYTVDAI